ncbi:peroxide stress protein YaaA [Litorimonas sp. RW-G-Af-16]|uniref:peroxide stress protein YaaA n=1 Tax=Litorimonas sp. RW-G-Af-16 TaxID=3241168 RepID=UPI00390CBC76
MITLLSPAKKLNFDPADTALEATNPQLHSDMVEIAKVAKQQSAADLKRLMHISDNLAELNADRFKSFNLDGQSNSAKPAGLTFDGDVYWGLDAKTLSDQDLEFAQTHLRILSGLYGVLRPLDLMQAYRLEMGTKMENPRGKSLYDFWGDKIANTLRDDLNGHHDHTIVNLASNEYFKAVDQKALDKPVVFAKFLETKDGKTRPVQYYTKFARGLMARWITQERVDRADGLRDFNLGDYKFDASQSSDDKLVFTRPQPAPKNG